MDNILNIFNMYSSTGNVFIPLLLFSAFIAGILSSLSPCNLGLLPLIIAYIGGYSKEGNKKLFVQMLSFSLGLSLILSIIGVLCAFTGRAFSGVSSPILILVLASIFVLMGLNLIGILEINYPVLIKKIPQNKANGYFVFPFLIGCVFALASSPCATPILASLLALATVSKNMLLSLSLFFLFALGQCLVIILFALFTSVLKNAQKFARFSSILMKISGIILIGAGIYIYYKIFSSI